MNPVERAYLHYRSKGLANNPAAGIAGALYVRNQDPHALETQLDFVLTECANSYPSVWRAIEQGNEMPLSEFVSIFVREYENPRYPQPEITRALAIAQAILRPTP